MCYKPLTTYISSAVILYFRDSFAPNNLIDFLCSHLKVYIIKVKKFNIYLPLFFLIMVEAYNGVLANSFAFKSFSFPSDSAQVIPRFMV